MMNRRGFLSGLAGVFAAGVAPAIVSNPMKIFVPKQDIVLPRTGRGLTSSIFHIDEAPFIDVPPTWDPKLAGEIQEQLVEKIRQMSYQLYTDSGYVTAAQQVDRLVIQEPKMVQYLQGGLA